MNEKKQGRYVFRKTLYDAWCRDAGVEPNIGTWQYECDGCTVDPDTYSMTGNNGRKYSCAVEWCEYIEDEPKRKIGDEYMVDKYNDDETPFVDLRYYGIRIFDIVKIVAFPESDAPLFECEDGKRFFLPLTRLVRITGDEKESEQNDCGLEWVK